MSRPPAARARKAPPAPTGWRLAAAEFAAGLAEPSRTAAISLAAGLAASLAVMLWFFHPSTLAGPMGAFLPSGERNAAAFVTVEALRLAREEAGAGRVIVLGSSTMAQACSDGSAIEEEIASDGWDVRVLATPLQSPLDQLSLLRTVLGEPRADAPPVIVLLGIGMQRLAWDAERMLAPRNRGRLGLRSDWEDDEIALMGGEPDPRLGLYPVDNFRFVSVNGPKALARLAARAPATRAPDFYAEGEGAEGDARLMPLFRDQIAAGEVNRSFYLDFHRRLAERLSDWPNVRLVLVEEPLAPDLIDGFDMRARYEAFHEEAAAFADEIGAQYWPLMHEAALSPSDYHDALHVRRGAPQERLRALLARRIDRAIEGLGA